jgi:hypothetical protein
MIEMNKELSPGSFEQVTTNIAVIKTVGYNTGDK